MAKGMKSKTGSAPIRRRGHTSSGQFGSNPQAKTKGRSTPRDLKAK